MKIRPNIIQNKTNSRTSPLGSNRTQCQKQCFNPAPLDIAVDRISENSPKRFPMPAVHLLQRIALYATIAIKI